MGARPAATATRVARRRRRLRRGDGIGDALGAGVEWRLGGRRRQEGDVRAVRADDGFASGTGSGRPRRGLRRGDSMRVLRPRRRRLRRGVVDGRCVPAAVQAVHRGTAGQRRWLGSVGRRRFGPGRVDRGAVDPPRAARVERFERFGSSGSRRVGWRTVRATAAQAVRRGVELMPVRVRPSAAVQAFHRGRRESEARRSAVCRCVRGCRPLRRGRADDVTVVAIVLSASRHRQQLPHHKYFGAGRTRGRRRAPPEQARRLGRSFRVGKR